MTVLQEAHAELLAEGNGWMHAAKLLAHRFNLDPETVIEQLRKADDRDRREARQAKRAALADAA